MQVSYNLVFLPFYNYVVLMYVNWSKQYDYYNRSFYRSLSLY